MLAFPVPLRVGLWAVALVGLSGVILHPAPKKGGGKTTEPGIATFRSAAGNDGSISTGDGIAVPSTLPPSGYAGSFDGDGNFRFDGPVCFGFSQNAGLLDPPLVEGVPEPVDGCRPAAFQTLNGAFGTGIMGIRPGEPGEIRSIRFNWSDLVEFPAGKLTALSYELGFAGDDNVDGVVDTSQVMVWCEWPAGSAEEQAGAPLEDAKGCLSWIIAPCGGTVVRGPGPDTELPVVCAANEVATIPDSTDPTRVEAPVGQVSARNQKGRRWQTVVGRYVLPFQMFVLRASSTPPPPPAITSFMPTTAPVGTEVTLVGSNFTDTMAVTFNGTPADTVIFDAETRVRAAVPPGATSGPISATIAGGTGWSADNFTVTTQSGGPLISSFTPTSGPVGTEVTLFGTNLTGLTTVAFNGTSATGVVTDSETQVQAIVPAGATTGPISVASAAGSSTSGDFFFVVAPPSDLFGTFNSRQIPLELQAWWAPNFGHIHAAARLPLGQEVSGTLQFDVRVLLHNNPGELYELRIDSDRGNQLTIPLNEICPYDGTESTNCAFNVPVSLDTTKMADGWRELRIRATTRTVDGKRFLNSSGIPIFVNNGNPRDDYNRFCNNTSLIGRGWYEDFGYSNAIIECVPLEPVSGAYTFRVRAQKASGHLTVVLDKTHYIPAVGSWPEQPVSEGQILFDEDGDHGTFFPISVDTTTLADGWHSLAVKSTSPDGAASTCSYCQGEINHTSGVAKVWFYVQNDTTTGG